MNLSMPIKSLILLCILSACACSKDTTVTQKTVTQKMATQNKPHSVKSTVSLDHTVTTSKLMSEDHIHNETAQDIKTPIKPKFTKEQLIVTEKKLRTEFDIDGLQRELNQLNPGASIPDLSKLNFPPGPLRGKEDIGLIQNNKLYYITYGDFDCNKKKDIAFLDKKGHLYMKLNGSPMQKIDYSRKKKSDPNSYRELNFRSGQIKLVKNKSLVTFEDMDVDGDGPELIKSTKCDYISTVKGVKATMKAFYNQEDKKVHFFILDVNLG